MRHPASMSLTCDIVFQIADKVRFIRLLNIYLVLHEWKIRFQTSKQNTRETDIKDKHLKIDPGEYHNTSLMINQHRSR